MRTENGIDVDYEALAELFSRADVLTIGFTLFPQRLLADLRSNPSDGQLVTIVEPVASVQERYHWLGQHRGSFGAPQGFSFIVWPKTVGALLEGTVLIPLRARLDGAGREQLEEMAGRLRAFESQATQRAVKGAPEWPTIWDRHGSSRKERGPL